MLDCVETIQKMIHFHSQALVNTPGTLNCFLISYAHLLRKTKLVRLIISFIPLAIAAITPAMLAVVLFLIGLERGLSRAISFMTGRLVTYLGWCIALFAFTDRFFNVTPDEPSALNLLLKAILGIFLLAMALKITLGGEDPDALPSRVVDVFTNISSIQLFGLGIIVSLFQVRHIILLFVGVTNIVSASLSLSLTIISTLILILMINASQLLLIGAYMAFSDQADNIFQSFDHWLSQNSRILAIVVGLIGIYFLLDSISGLGEL